MVRYCRSYGDFTLLDGTFNISAYSLVLLKFTNVDCLGNTVIGGFAFAPTESSEHVIRAHRAFYPNAIPGISVLMTDGAAFANAASELELHHLLCVKHFEVNSQCT